MAHNPGSGGLFTNYLAGQAALESAQADISCAEFHGTLCAFLCTRAPVDCCVWVDEIVIQGAADDCAGDSGAHALWRDCLAEIGELTHAAFAGGECDLEILLPDDDQPLAVRSQALIDWCCGFLYGFGLQPAAVGESLSADAREVIDDILEFTHIEVAGEADDGQVAEKSYVELVEYLRVGVLLIYEEIIRGAETAVADSGPLH